MAENETSGTIVIGVDGSDGAWRALAWALDEARTRHMRCLLVHAVDLGIAAASPFVGDAFEQLRVAGQTILDDAVELARHSGVEVAGRLEIGPAAHALVEASRGAALVVVGSRGRGGFAGLLLGSVSTACVHHAHCPVVVIRPADAAPAVAGGSDSRAAA